MATVDLPNHLATAMDKHLEDHPHFDSKAELIEEWARQTISVPVKD
ncbi:MULTISPECIES: hypothetical protein [Halorussus]|nr:hypothetical protein [Halorussus vallis]USZ74062.1 hypothetical protein NGM07_11405 [Halorussus vallis]